jgi:hypothetical protein
MKVEILRSVMISGEPVKAGSLVEVTAADANLLIGMGKARPAVEPEPALEVPKKGRKSTTSAPIEEA